MFSILADQMSTAEINLIKYFNSTPNLEPMEKDFKNLTKPIFKLEFRDRCEQMDEVLIM